MRKNASSIVAICWLMISFSAIAAAQGKCQNGTSCINTVAGGGPNNLPANASSIGIPYGIALDGSGNTYVSDSFTNRVYKIDSKQNLTVVAGNIVNSSHADGRTYDGGPATQATLATPQGVAVDSAGNLYIADSVNNVIRFVNTTGAPFTILGSTINAGDIVSIVGNGTACDLNKPCGDGEAATSAMLSGPQSVWLDSKNNIYIADTLDDVVRVVNTQSTAQMIAGVANIQPGTIVAIAGNYMACNTSCGDNGAGTNAQLSNPSSVWLDKNNNVYIADTLDQTVRLLDAGTGTITLVAGTYFTTCPGSPCGDGGLATNAEFNQPLGVSGDNNGNLYIADTGDQVVRVVNSPNINLVAGTYFATFPGSPCGDGGAATAATFDNPTNIFADTSGNVFVVDETDNAIREVTGGNISTTIGRILLPEYSGDGSLPTSASLYTPSGVTTDAAGNLYIADAQNDAVRFVNNQKSSITIAGVTIAAGDIQTIAGDGTPCSTQTCGDDGPPASAQLDGPSSVALDASGNIYIADSLDSAIRVINVQASPITIAGVSIGAGLIKTISGTGTPGYNGDQCPASGAELNVPVGVRLDSSGNIFVVDGNPFGTNNDIVRVINPLSSGSPVTIASVSVGPTCIATIAGTQGQTCTGGGCGDGGAATAAKLNGPTNVAIDKSDNVYIADDLDNQIRYVDNKTGIITTVAGNGSPCTSGNCGDGGPATSAQLSNPFDVFLDYNGTLYISDPGDFVVRAVNTGTASITVDTIPISPADINTVVGFGQYGFTGDGGSALGADLANPLGLGGDTAGDLFVTDNVTWRVRSVQNLVVSAPTATLSANPLVLPATILGDSSSVMLTITNNGNGTNLTISSITISGTNSGDFKETNKNCTTVPPNGGTPCTVTVTFTPGAAGARTATLSITDNASNSPQLVTLSGSGVATLQANPTSRTVSAGGSANYTITVPSQGFTGNMTLSCPAGLPTGAACTFSPATVAPGKTSTLTITTTAPSSSMLAPQYKRGANWFYAIWLLLPAMFLSTAGMTALNRKKLTSYLLLTLAIAGVLFLVACGGGNSTSGGGGGTPTGGTPAGSYTITVQGVAGATTATQKITLTVQ